MSFLSPFARLWCTCIFIIVIHLRFGVYTFLPHKNTPPTIFPESNAIVTFSVKVIMAWVVLCRFLNSNCLLYKISLSSRRSITESASIFSNIFDINGNTEIGL